jgi:hypothetical protein
VLAAYNAGLGGCKEESLERDTLALANQAGYNANTHVDQFHLYPRATYVVHRAIER